MTKQCFDEFHRLFGIRYPFGNYHQAFVPEFNAGAMENPGCVTFRDPLIFSSRVTRGVRIQRATTVAHEMAHQWFGNITTPAWWDDLWLNESFAEYMGNRVTADVTEYDDAWTHNAYARRQWGLIADQRPSTHPVAGNDAVDAGTALQNFDGISYAKGSSILKQLNATMGDEVFFAGVIDHFTRHRFGNATMHDLFASWERAGAGDLSAFTGSLAAHGRARHDRARPRRRRDPAYPARRAPGRPAAHAARRHRRRRRTLDHQHARDRRRRDAVRRPRTQPRSSSTPTRTPGRWSSRTPTTVQALKALLPDHRRQPAAGRHLEQRAQRLPQRRHRTRRRAGPDGGHGAERDQRRRACSPRCRGSSAGLRRSLGDPAAALALIHETALDRVLSAPDGSTLQLAAFQAAMSSATEPSVLRGWLAGGQLLPARASRIDLDLRWRGLFRLAAMGEADRGRARRGPGRRAHRPIARRARPVDGRAAGRRGQGMGLGPLHRRGGRPQLRARGHRPGHVATRSGGPDRALRRPLLRRGARHR